MLSIADSVALFSIMASDCMSRTLAGRITRTPTKVLRLEIYTRDKTDKGCLYGTALWTKLLAWKDVDKLRGGPS